MTDKETKPKSPASHPPEPTFYDPPEKVINLKPVIQWFKKRWLRVLIVGSFLILIILHMFFSPKNSSKIQRIVTGEEK